ncbi:MAG: hypothetical protein ACRENF_02795, partial [Thermodesulfobacteriota bacterium]
MDERVREEILSKRPELPKLLLLVLVLLIGLGIFTFVSRAIGPDGKEAWQIYLVNFIFWTGVALGGIAFSCALRLTQGRWGRPLLRISEALGSFVPVSFILLLVLLLVGKDHVLPYATQHYHHPKDIWLNMSFVTARQIIGFLALFTLSY